MKTAKELLWDDVLSPSDTEPYGHVPIPKIYDAMIEFAQMHVKAALEAAGKVDIEDVNHPEANDFEEAMRLWIRDCYPLENIK